MRYDRFHVRRITHRRCDDLDGYRRGQQCFEPPLEAAFDQVVQGALATAADEDAFAAVYGGVLREQHRSVRAGVVDGENRNPNVMRRIKKSRECALGRLVGLEGEL